MSEAKDSFWATTPGLLAGIAAIITAITGYLALSRNETKPTQTPVAAVTPSDSSLAPATPQPGGTGARVTDTFVSMASEPFYFDQKILLTRADLRSAYEALRREKGSVWRELEIVRIKVQTARELANNGHDLSRDRIFGSMNLTPDDYAVTVVMRLNGREEGSLIVLRRLPTGFEVVGTWD